MFDTPFGPRFKLRRVPPPKNWKKCRPWDGHSRGTMQRWRSCQNPYSIQDSVVPMVVCTHALYTLTVTVQLSFWPIRASHPSRGHHTDTTQSQILSSGSLTKKLAKGSFTPLLLFCLDAPRNLLNSCVSTALYSYLRVVHSRKEVVQEVVAKGCEHNRLAEYSPGIWRLVHISGSVQHMKAPVTLCS